MAWANDKQPYSGGWYNEQMNSGGGGGSYGGGWGQSSSGAGARPQGNYNVKIPQNVGYGRFAPQPGYATGGWDPTGMTAASAQASGLADQYQRGQDMWQGQQDERRMAIQQQYQMQQLQAQLQSQQQNQWMQMYASGMNMPTGDQIERSRGDLGQSLKDFANQRDNGRYNQGEMDTLSGDMYNKINSGAMETAKNFNQQQASRGSYSSPGASAALRMGGQFNANAARGSVQADLLRENKQAQDVGRAGYADISSQLADYASRPINRMADMDWSQMFGGQMPPGFGPSPQAPDGFGQNGLQQGNGKQWNPKQGTGGQTQFSFSNGMPSQSQGPVNIGEDDFEKRKQQMYGGGY